MKSLVNYCSNIHGCNTCDNKLCVIVVISMVGHVR